MAQQSEPAWIDWAHKNGFSTIYQAHGTPANWLDLYGDADMPETEMFHNDRSILISKFASSAAHTQGRPLTGAETGTWLKEHFTETLADVKYLADDMFLVRHEPHFLSRRLLFARRRAVAGLAVLRLHGNEPAQSHLARRAGAERIHRALPVRFAIRPARQRRAALLARRRFLEPAGRDCVQPMTVGKTDWFEGQPIGKTAHELWDQGYAFDYVSDAQLKAGKSRGMLKNPDARRQLQSHRRAGVQIHAAGNFPNNCYALAENGARINFQTKLPDDISGLEKACRNSKKSLNSSKANLSFEERNNGSPLFQRNLHSLARGELRFYRHDWHSLGTAIEPMKQVGLSFIRRSFDGGWNYFIANRAETNFDGWITLGRVCKISCHS